MPQPKAHKYNRSQRLLKAKIWLESYNGKKIHRGYAKHFGISKLCAITELEMLGFEFPGELKASIIRNEEDKRKQREKRKKEKEISFIESDYHFAYIVGYTSGGASYGLTWEEMKEIEARELERGHDSENENTDIQMDEIDEYVDNQIDEIEDSEYLILKADSQDEDDLPF